MSFVLINPIYFSLDWHIDHFTRLTLLHTNIIHPHPEHIHITHDTQYMDMDQHKHKNTKYIDVLAGSAALKITSDRMVNYIERTGKRLTTEYFRMEKSPTEHRHVCYHCEIGVQWLGMLVYRKNCVDNHVKTICSFSYSFGKSEPQSRERSAKFRVESYLDYFAFHITLIQEMRNVI